MHNKQTSVLKSDISLFQITPVELETILDPKLKQNWRKNVSDQVKKKSFCHSFLHNNIRQHILTYRIQPNKVVQPTNKFEMQSGYFGYMFLYGCIVP